MTPRPKADRAAKRTEFAIVARRVFAKRGVANTTIGDIVKAAGVAQGTFYLYFDSKEDIVLVVAAQMVDAMVAAIEHAAHLPGASAVEKLVGLRDALTSLDTDPSAVELTDFIHRPENCALHDRLAEQLVPRLVPLVEAIVAQGVTEGAFNVHDTKMAAWFVLGGLQSIELAGTPAAEKAGAITAVTLFALRALGYTGEFE